MDYRIIIGGILILYGIVKIIFSFYELNDEKRKHEDTFADKFIIILLLLFGIYSLIHGIAMIIHNTVFGKVIDNINTFGIISIIFGVVMIELYAIIVYTNIPIPKNENKLDKYKLVGIGGGICFFLALFIKIVWYKYHNKNVGYWDYSIYSLLYWIILLSFIFILYLWNTYFNTKNEMGENISFLTAIVMNSV